MDTKYMFWILRKGLKWGFLALALYGIAHIPIHHKPLWKYVKHQSSDAFKVNQRVIKKKIKNWFGEFKKNLTQAFAKEQSAQNTFFQKNKKTQKKESLPAYREVIRASEEEKLKELLSGK